MVPATSRAGRLANGISVTRWWQPMVTMLCIERRTTAVERVSSLTGRQQFERGQRCRSHFREMTVVPTIAAVRVLLVI